ncbi:MAG: DNA repair protein RadC [Bacteroidetes bacterium]|nr:DNA repair protein RadC [Bacteroidota bacterium]
MEETKHFGIKEWAHDDRPREKMLSKGKAALSNAELLALLIGNGTRNKSAVALCQEILKLVKDDIVALGKLTEKDLMVIKGIGPAKAVTIAAAMELGRRRRAYESPVNDRLTKPREIYDYFNPEFENLNHEEFWIILLRRNLSVIKKERISVGGLHGTVVDITKIMKQAVEREASSLILAHNHPSGNLNPSAQDIDITKKIVEACKIFGITVLDHLIITDQGFYSFADEGQL